MTWIVQGHQKGEWYILAGNFNEPLQSTSSAIKLCSNSTLQVVDILSSMTDKKFSTTKTGKDRIGYILISLELPQAIQKKGYRSFNQMVFTDHRGVYLDLNGTSLFGSDTASLMNHNTHSIITKDPWCATKYITAAHKHLTDNHFWENIGILLQSHEPNHSLSEKLDTLLVQACTIAEMKCKM
eukprot:1367238-Ditylum_brightwellii.AAC.1